MEIQENNLLKLLIVDDQQREIDGIAHMLKWDTLGIEVAYCATEANKAIEILEKEQIDIVLTDIIMPDMDGLSLVQKIHAEYPNIKVVCCSCFDNIKFTISAVNNGASGYLLKPILTHEIQAIMYRIANEIREQRKAETTKNAISAYKFNLIRLINESISSFNKEDFSYWVDCIEEAAGIERLKEIEIALEKTANVGIDHAQQESCVQIIIDNITKHLTEKITNEMLTEGVYFSQNYAFTVFRNETGQSVHQYLLNARLEAACSLLLMDRKRKIADIAQELQFSDASHFNNCFKKRYGLTPADYRRTRHI